MNKPPLKSKNKDRRSREYLSETEIDKIMKAARKIGRHGNRDSTMILMSYRHGLRVSELIALKWQQIDLKSGLIYINRLKNGIDGVHPLFGPELRGLKLIQRDYKEETQYVFITERKTPITASTVRKMVMRAGVEAGIEFPIHPQVKVNFRESCARSCPFLLGYDVITGRLSIMCISVCFNVIDIIGWESIWRSDFKVILTYLCRPLLPLVRQAADLVYVEVIFA